MSRSVDERVVEMQFDHKQFESGIKTSLKSLDNLKKGLNFDSASKSLSNIEKQVKGFSLSGIEKGVDLISSRFTNLGIVGVTALQNITNAAIHAGTQMVKALTIDPVLTGFEEYETKMNAITTILTNTASKGTTLEDVNNALNELNTYADQTIYNFAEMTRNIGTFTAAGVDLDTATKAIKGIANLAAGSGSTSAQASTAMYQLSQAIAAGRVSLQDWNSVVNAGMGGELFQNALKETAKQMGIVVDESVSFRESISATGGKQSWLTSDVLVKTLEKFADDETLLKAATQVKTFTQLIDTMKESVQSGWAQSWEYIIGDREQATETLTNISNAFNSIIQPSTDARNAALQFWNVNGGREAVIQGITNVLKTLGDILGPIGDAFNDAFPAITGERLVDISKKFLGLTENFKIGDATAKNIKSTFSGLFSVIQLFGKAVSAVIKPVLGLTDGVGSIGSAVLSATGAFGDFLTKLNESSSVNEALSVISSSLEKATTSISNFISSVFKNTGSVNNFLKDFADGAVDILSTAASKLAEVIQWISDNVSIGDVFAGLAGVGIFVVAKKLAGVFDTIRDAIDNFLGNTEEVGKITDNFSEILSSIHDSINSFSTGIKVGSLVSIAIAIGILSASLNTISKIKSTSIAKSLTAIGIMMAELNLSFRSITKSLSKFDSKGIVKAGVSLITIATAIQILSSAVSELSKLDLSGIGKGLSGIAGMLAELSIFLKATDLKSASLKGSITLLAISGAIVIMADAIERFSSLSWEEIGKGLTTLAGALIGLVASIKILNGTKLSLRTSAAIFALAESCNILAEALSSFSQLSWDEIARGLTAMGGALAELVISLSVLSKVGGGGAFLGASSILIAVQSLDEISENLKQLARLSWEEIGKGLTAMGGALAELGIVSGVLGKITGFSGLLGSTSILIAVQSLKPIADALEQISTLSWEEIGKGLTGMVGALTELGVVAGLLGKIAGFSGLLGSASILVMVQSLQPIADTLEQLGALSWSEIAKGLVGMGLALAELGVIAGLLGSLAPLSILGSGSIFVGVQGLGTLAEAMQKFGSMTWEEIAKGLVGMGGALTELGVVAGLLGTLAPLSILGSGSLLLGVQGLGDLADALKKFGEMDWDTIGHGLAAMGAAMGETALGGVLNTLSGFGAAAIAEMAPALGELADSLSKWKNVQIPANLGVSLGILADGVMKFTFGGFGAGALSTAAPGLGEMADAVRKWQNVTIPDGLEDGLNEIANGVKSFTWAFAGGWSIDQVIEPLGQLATTVKKWNGVTIPQNIGDGLSDLADGIGSFTWTFAAGWSISEVVEPLGDLASAVQKWSWITIPEGIGDGLSSLANGVQAFAGYDYSTMNLSSIGTGLMSIGSAAINLSGINFAYISSGLTSFAAAISGLPTQLSGVGESIVSAISSIPPIILSQAPAINSAIATLMNGEISGISSSLNTLTKTVSNFSVTIVAQMSSATNGVSASIQTMASVVLSSSGMISSAFSSVILSGINAIQARSGQLNTTGRTIIMSFINTVNLTISSSTSSLRASITMLFTVMVTSALQVVENSKGKLQNEGRSLIQAFINGMSSMRSSARSSASSIASAAESGVSGYYWSFYNAGNNMIQGLVSGIYSGRSDAISAASSVAYSALSAAKDALDIHSPSGEFEDVGIYSDEGLIRGLLRMATEVENASESVAESALSGARLTLNRLPGILSSDLNTSPRITPVLDLSRIQSGANEMNQLFPYGYSIQARVNTNDISTVSRNLSNRVAPGNNRNYGPDILEAFNSLGNRVDALGDRIAAMGIVLDTGATVGGISTKMDKTLGRMADYKGRNI